MYASGVWQIHNGFWRSFNIFSFKISLYNLVFRWISPREMINVLWLDSIPHREINIWNIVIVGKRARQREIIMRNVIITGKPHHDRDIICSPQGQHHMKYNHQRKTDASKGNKLIIRKQSRVLHSLGLQGHIYSRQGKLQIKSNSQELYLRPPSVWPQKLCV